MWNVYILFCNQKTYYVGITDNLQRRLKQHKSGESFFTKKFSEIEFLYKENYKTRAEAEKRESQLKKWSVKKRRPLLTGTLSY